MVAAAAETVALVLGEDSLLESDRDVADLAQRLRDHVMQLSGVVPEGSALARAKELGAAPMSRSHFTSRPRLRELAAATQVLIDTAAAQTATATAAAPGSGSRQHWLFSRHAARVAVFAVAVALLVIASSSPQR
jgi:hypothetical protein